MNLDIVSLKAETSGKTLNIVVGICRIAGEANDVDVISQKRHLISVIAKHASELIVRCCIERNITYCNNANINVSL